MFHRKFLAKPIGIDEKRRAATFTVSTADPDRVGDIIAPEGVDLTHYAKNPVWLLGHSMSTIIGTSESPEGRLAIQIEPGKRILATCFFHGATTEARQAWQGVVEGWLRAASIGFNPLEPAERLKTGGLLFKRWELLEISLVAVPANPHCVIVRSHLARGTIAGEPIAAAIAQTLEPIAAGARKPGRAKGGNDPILDAYYRRRNLDGELILRELNKAVKRISNDLKAVLAMHGLLPTDLED